MDMNATLLSGDFYADTNKLYTMIMEYNLTHDIIKTPEEAKAFGLVLAYLSDKTFQVENQILKSFK
jgi:hypothetical protein